VLSGAGSRMDLISLQFTVSTWTDFGKSSVASPTAWLGSSNCLTFELDQALICYGFTEAEIWGSLLSYEALIIKFDLKCFCLVREAASSTLVSSHRFTYAEPRH
jgi:hypothetical protein